MAKLSKEAKQRLQQLFRGGQFAIRWGFIPLVIYLAYFGAKRLFDHLDLDAINGQEQHARYTLWLR